MTVELILQIIENPWGKFGLAEKNLHIKEVNSLFGFR
jgi:hypothetical protein